MAVKKLKDIYPGYFQKSRVFIFPVLGIKQSSNTPLETYIAWDDLITTGEMKLVVEYHLRDDKEFVAFEEKSLLGNRLFENYRELPDEKAAYIFDITEYQDDWACFIKGKYSLLSESLKKSIRDYYGITSPNYAFIHSYLNPMKYYADYAQFLCPTPEDRPDMIKLIRKVGELCDKPNLEKEMLKVRVRSLDFNII